VRLTEAKGAQVAQVSSEGGRGNAGGLSAAARELGLDRDDEGHASKARDFGGRFYELAVPAAPELNGLDTLHAGGRIIQFHGRRVAR
jgi:hypothetical protein